MKKLIALLALGVTLCLPFAPALADEVTTAVTAAASAAVEAAPAADVAAAPAATDVAPSPVPDKGDTAWMLMATVLVIFMSLPGLALFYGGLVRSKNMLSVLTQVFVIFCVIALLWVTYGYSVAFSAGGSLNAFFGGLSKAFLSGVGTDAVVETFSKGVVIPELLFMVFQLTFAAITVALIVGGFVERIKFAALLAFAVLWFTLSYLPMAHMVWFWGGPSAYADPSGFIFGKGALDFAGGTVVHINAAMAALVGAVVIGKRIGYGKEKMAPHSLTMTMIGASMLWVGWFGFNAGSNLEATGTAVLAMVNTVVATAAAALSWMAAEWLLRGKPSLLGVASGCVAGLVAVTPACGFIGPMGAIVLGLVAGVLCFWGVTGLKKMLGADDSLDVFGVHGVGGIFGALATGVLASPALGGTGVFDYAAGKVAEYSLAAQVTSQAWGVGVTILWSGIVSYLLFKLIDITIGLRVSDEQEREGLDTATHGERAYDH
jgi:Amt family ammonium transporter